MGAVIRMTLLRSLVRSLFPNLGKRNQNRKEKKKVSFIRFASGEKGGGNGEEGGVSCYCLVIGGDFAKQ